MKKIFFTLFLATIATTIRAQDFWFRQIPSYEARVDTAFKALLRAQVPGDVFVAGYWVHTFNKLMPARRYGASHPEYYAYYNGERHPGSAAQWCLSNPEVVEIVAAQLDSLFAAYPDRKIISVSQNDGNGTYCRCPECAKIDSLEGSQAGSLITFVNCLAERFPDKQISTLAYLYTMHPPKNVKPLPNVNVMLCSIDADRERPLTETGSGRQFCEALYGWSAISDNIYIWDYAINFDNYLSPFPNFHTLKPNLKLFKDNGATMVHVQMSGAKGTNFEALRSYLAAQLAWDVDADVDSLMNGFLARHYGAAASFLREYIDLQTEALLDSGARLWIYDSPVSLAGSVLTDELIKRYNELFDDAETAVADDAVKLERVRTERMTLQYSTLEILRTRHDSDPAEMEKLLQVLETRAAEYGITMLNERCNSPIEYCKLYRERYMPRAGKSLAQGASVEFSAGGEPTAKYAALGRTALTDGLYGGSTFVESWVGWEGKDGVVVVDLGALRKFTKVSADFLHQLGQWIMWPKKVTFAVSANGTKFRRIGTVEIAEDRSLAVKFRAVQVESPAGKTFKGRYVRLEIEGVKICPEWHYGVGHPCWFFMDEITVD